MRGRAAYGMLRPMKRYRWAWSLLLILLPSLACQAAMRLVTGAPPQSTATSAPTLAARSQPTQPVSCPQEARSVMLAANVQSIVPTHFPSVDTSRDIDIPLVTYNITGSRLSAPMLSRAPDNLVPYQRDFDKQRAAWSLFATMIPAGERGILGQFQIMTDGPGGVLSAVEQSADDPRSWVLEADIADMSDTKNLAFTLLHEFGHLLTLGPSQVPPDLQVFNNPNGSRARERAIAACNSYFPGEGCSLGSSYINRFFDRFWKDLYDQWDAIDQVQDVDQREAQLNAFYNRNRDQFVDSYAATSPVEDIAESWAFFVLEPRPAGTSIVEQKLQFFYAYPELVTLREQILSGLCAANP
jgi:hypothetical protein